MQVKNIELNDYIEFLSEMSLSNKASLGRTKLKQAFVKKLEELNEDQVEIVNEFDAWEDKEKGTYSSDIDKLNEVMDILLNDEVGVSFNSPFKQDLIIALENYDEELSGINAEVYANLYEDLTGGN